MDNFVLKFNIFIIMNHSFHHVHLNIFTLATPKSIQKHAYPYTCLPTKPPNQRPAQLTTGTCGDSGCGGARGSWGWGGAGCKRTASNGYHRENAGKGPFKWYQPPDQPHISQGTIPRGPYHHCPKMTFPGFLAQGIPGFLGQNTCLFLYENWENPPKVEFSNLAIFGIYLRFYWKGANRGTSGF